MTIRKGRCLRGLVVAVLACCMIPLLAAVTFAKETEGVVSEEPESAASEVTECAAVDAPVAEATAVSDEKTGGESLKDQGVEEVNEAYDYTVETGGDSVGASAGISYGGWASLGSKLSYMKFPEGTTAPDGSDGIWCYCIDISTDTKDGHKYAITTLDAAGYYDETAAAKIRSILLNSYPNLSISELENIYQLPGLTEEEAFMATQWILWYYSNPDGLVDAGGGNYYPADIYKPSEYPRSDITVWYDDEDGNEVRTRSSNIVALAKALDQLAPAAAYETEPADITMDKKVYSDKVVFDYNGSKGLNTLKNIDISMKDSNGKEVPFTRKGNTIIVQRADVSMAGDFTELIVEFKAEQELVKDVYFFSPEGGRDASQSRVAAYGGTVPVAKDTVFTLMPSEFKEAENDPSEEPETPTAPGEQEVSDKLTEPIEDEDTAMQQKGRSPKTGDDNNILPLMAAATLSMIGVVGALLFRRKKA
ncbi:MAG: Cys-Gln thioester bond-forming surface protein [Firmicutes bacterium]|nr:Cys-Gln thioester bond-forming surface protein [Bacillota bacterium]